MSIFNRKKKTEELKEDMSGLPPLDERFRAPTKRASYIEVAEGKKGQVFLRIMGGNHKTRMVSETYYTGRNATRAAQLLSEDTGLAIVDRRQK